MRGSVVKNAVHVGPDFDALSTQPSAYDSRRKIGAAPSNRRRDTGAVRPNKPAHHGNPAGIEQRLHLVLQPLVRFFHLRHRFHITAVGDQNFPRIHVRSFQPVSRKRRCHNLAGKHFTECGHMVGRPRRDFADRRNAAQQFVQPLEISSQFRMEIGEQRRPQQFARGVVMSFLQRPAEFERGLALPGSGSARHREQRIGNLGHGADHDYGPLRQPVFYDGGHTLDGPGVFHRSTAEFHHDHRRNSLAGLRKRRS